MSHDINLFLPLATTFDVLRSRVRDPFQASVKIEGLGELDEQLQQITILSADGEHGSWIEGASRITPDSGLYEDLASRGVDAGDYRVYLVHASKWAWSPFDEVLVQLIADDRAFIQFEGYPELQTSNEFLDMIANASK